VSNQQKLLILQVGKLRQKSCFNFSFLQVTYTSNDFMKLLECSAHNDTYVQTKLSWNQ